MLHIRNLSTNDQRALRDKGTDRTIPVPES
jgi:hypothetical protein